MQILIADDHPLFRDALKRAVQQCVPEAVIFEAEDVVELLALVNTHAKADLLLMDLNMPGAQGFSALVHVRAMWPTLPVLMVSAQDDPALMRRAVGHGASGFIPKSSSIARIGEAIRAVLDGDAWLPPGVDASKATLDPEERQLAARIAELTPQQYRVLGMLCQGLLNKQIAYELQVSEATIKAHMTAVLRKLGAHSRTQAALLAGRLTLEGRAPELPQPEGDLA
jgi:DNA-binding NarL/FixJ family response regulator